MTTISTSIITTVTLGESGTSSPLTVTAGGSIKVSAASTPGAAGGDAVDASTVSAAYSVTNNGVLSAGAGGAVSVAGSGYAGAGGIGINLSGASAVINSATVDGGNGGTLAFTTAPSLGQNGGGGVGVVVAGGASSGSLSNSTTSAVIRGGAGYAGGFGGNGVDFGGATFTNAGNVFGGNGGDGGVGVALAAGTLTNQGGVYGGAGGFEFAGGAGGAGIQLSHNSGATVKNYGIVQGGSADNATVAGGAGLIATGTTSIINETSGLIIGGNAGGALSAGAAVPAGGTGVSISGTGAALTNDGTIKGGASGVLVAPNLAGDTAGGTGVAVAGGASLTTSGQIDGGAGSVGTTAGDLAGAGGSGLIIDGAASSAQQSGGDIAGGTGGTGATQSAGTGGAGVTLTNGGSMTTTAGTLSGGAGGATQHALGSVSVTGGTGGAGVVLEAGSTFTATHTIITGGAGGRGTYAADTDGNGGVGVELAGGTFVTSTHISGGAAGTSPVGAASGTAGDAVDFKAGDQSTLQVNSGAYFGTRSFAGLYGNAIGGFASGDTIDVTNLTQAQVLADFGATGSTVGSTLQFAGSAAGETLTSTSNQNDGTLTLAGNFAGDTFVLKSDGGSGTDITVQAACYVRGTRIRTRAGDVPIEKLSVGDAVVTGSGEVRAIRWLGHRRIDCARHPNRQAVWPIRIQAGAFAEEVPVRDLWVSPGHMLLIGDELIHAENLVNGATVQQIDCPSIEYWHVELDRHDIVFAEGMPAETYLDTGNRTVFVGGGAFLEAHPHFRPKHWSETCRPLIQEGPSLQAARAHLLERAHALGFCETTDCAAHVVADGQRVEPIMLGENRLAFLLPEACNRVELRSRTFVPRHRQPESGDDRSLGICVGRLQIDGIDVSLADEEMFAAAGWHGVEYEADLPVRRWTRGKAQLPPGTRLVIIDVASRSYAWVAPTQKRATVDRLHSAQRPVRRGRPH